MGKKRGNLRTASVFIVVLLLACRFAEAKHIIEARVNTLAERVDRLTKNQVRLESAMKSLAKQARQENGVWSDRKREIEQRLFQRIDEDELKSANWSTILALAEVGFILPLKTSQDATVQEQLKNLYMSEQKRLTRGVKTLNSKKNELEEKMRKLRELREKVQLAKENYDIKLESYKRKLNFVKFKESLVRAAQDTRQAMINQRAAEEENIRKIELIYMSDLKSDSSFIDKKLSEKSVHDSAKKARLGLPTIHYDHNASIASHEGHEASHNSSIHADNYTNTTSGVAHGLPGANSSVHGDAPQAALNTTPENEGRANSDEPSAVINNLQTYTKTNIESSQRASPIQMTNSTGLNEQQEPVVVVTKVNSSIPINALASNATNNTGNRTKNHSGVHRGMEAVKVKAQQLVNQNASHVANHKNHSNDSNHTNHSQPHSNNSSLHANHASATNASLANGSAVASKVNASQTAANTTSTEVANVSQAGEQSLAT